MVLEKKILNDLMITNYEVIKKYKSKRNQVYLIEASINSKNIKMIYKNYVAGNASKDMNTLNMLDGIKVPKVLAYSRNLLCVEYIDGENLLDIFINTEKANKSFDIYADALIGFLDSFYRKASTYIFGDVNLRNFIFFSGVVYGVDVEDVDKGDVHADIGKIAAFMLKYYKEDTNYKVLASTYFVFSACHKLNLDIDRVNEEKEKEIINISKRRSKNRDS